MPYSFRGVNAAYVNAYAFPGGSIAATRGILVELRNEAELRERHGGRILNINYCLPDSVDLPFQFAIFFNILRNKTMPDGNTSPGYAKVATQSDTAFRHTLKTFPGP